MSNLLFPQRINIEPTNFCNQKCLFCPRGEMERDQGNMKLDLFRKIVDDCEGHKVKIWLQFMGEPFLNPALIEMVEYAHKKNVSQVGLSTNASYLNAKNISLLLDSPLDRLELSLDAVDKDYFIHMRGIDEFDKVRTNMMNFLRQKKERGKTKPVTSVQFMRTTENQANRQQVIDFWKPHLMQDDFIMMIDEVPFLGYERHNKHQEPLKTKPRDSRPPCDWLWKYAVILWNGDVALCVSDYDGTEILGNVNSESLTDIWNGKKVGELRGYHTERRFDKIKNCSTCQLWLTPGEYTNILAEQHV